MIRVRSACLAGLCMLALCAATSALQAQTLYTVNINTTGLNGLSGGLAFDFISGDNVTPNNTALITSFATNGTLLAGSNANTGTASGNLPGTLTLRDSGFSEAFQGEAFGTTLSYTLSLTNTFAAPGAPDGFSFFLTDPANSGTVVSTSDPTGADALFIVELNGAQTAALTVFTSNTPGVSYSVRAVGANTPEPSPLAFTMAGLGVGGLLLRSRRCRA